MGCFIA